MFKTKITPRFCDTDAQGHISNTVLPVWLLEGRQHIVEIYSDDIIQETVGLALVRQEIDYKAECFYGQEVEVLTRIIKLGDSSIHVDQQVWQDDKQCAASKAILVCFNKAEKSSQSIPTHVREELEKHLVETHNE